MPRETAPVAADVVAKALQAFTKNVAAMTRPAISAPRDMGKPLIDISAVDAQAPLQQHTTAVQLFVRKRVVGGTTAAAPSLKPGLRPSRTKKLSR